MSSRFSYKPFSQPSSEEFLKQEKEALLEKENRNRKVLTRKEALFGEVEKDYEEAKLHWDNVEKYNISKLDDANTAVMLAREYAEKAKTRLDIFIRTSEDYLLSRKKKLSKEESSKELSDEAKDAIENAISKAIELVEKTNEFVTNITIDEETVKKIQNLAIEARKNIDSMPIFVKTFEDRHRNPTYSFEEKICNRLNMITYYYVVASCEILIKALNFYSSNKIIPELEPTKGTTSIIKNAKKSRRKDENSKSIINYKEAFYNPYEAKRNVDARMGKTQSLHKYALEWKEYSKKDTGIKIYDRNTKIETGMENFRTKYTPNTLSQYKLWKQTDEYFQKYSYTTIKGAFDSDLFIESYLHHSMDIGFTDTVNKFRRKAIEFAKNADTLFVQLKIVNDLIRKDGTKLIETSIANDIVYAAKQFANKDEYYGYDFKSKTDKVEANKNILTLMNKDLEKFNNVYCTAFTELQKYTKLFTPPEQKYPPGWGPSGWGANDMPGWGLSQNGGGNVVASLERDKPTIKTYVEKYNREEIRLNNETYNNLLLTIYRYTYISLYCSRKVILWYKLKIMMDRVSKDPVKIRQNRNISKEVNEARDYLRKLSTERDTWEGEWNLLLRSLKKSCTESQAGGFRKTHTRVRKHTINQKHNQKHNNKYSHKKN